MQYTGKHLADMLTDQELNFANLWLSAHVHGLSREECYITAGYADWDASANSAAKLAAPHITAYLDVHSAPEPEVLPAAPQEPPKSYPVEVLPPNPAVDLDYLDRKLGGLISADIGEVLTSYARVSDTCDPITGEPVVLHIPVLRCAISDMSPAARASIQSIRMTPNGPEVKLYSRLDAIKLALMRIGAAPVGTDAEGEFNGLSDAELDARIRALTK